MMWSKNGTLHRDNNNPATENYTFENGILTNWSFTWVKNGRLHRNGFMPAIMSFGPDGLKKEYYVNGEHVPPPTDAHLSSLYLSRKLPKDLVRWDINSFLGENEKRKLDQIEAIKEQRKAGVAAFHDELDKKPKTVMANKYKYFNAGGRFPKRGKNTSRRIKRIKRKSSLKRKK